MAMTTAYTLTEAREMLGMWKECEKAIASGQAKSYRVGTREYTALDLDEISKRIEYFSNAVEALQKKSRNHNVKIVTPRDL